MSLLNPDGLPSESQQSHFDQILVILIPAHNEQEEIYNTCKAWAENTIWPGPKKIYVVENGSSDNTWEEIQRAKQDVESERCSLQPLQTSNAGLGYAFLLATKTFFDEPRSVPIQNYWIHLTGADLPFKFTDVVEFVALLKNNKSPNIMIGSKAHPESKLDTPFVRRFLSKSFLLARKIILKSRVDDSQGTFFIHAPAFSNWAQRIKATDYMYTAELCAIAEKYNLEIIERPITYSTKGARPSKVRLFEAVRRMLSATIDLKRRMRSFEI